ncbi:MAG: PAS domain S-box protein, partial [Chloroflexi bacterium]|nr:PAS domain S-box protein [Chloroflexota bacterium]
MKKKTDARHPEPATTEAASQSARDALRASEPLYHSLVEALPQCLCRKDLAGRFTFANSRFCDSLNKTLDEIIGRTDFDIHPPALAEKYRRDDQWVIGTGQNLEAVEEHLPLGGQSTWVQVLKTPVRDAGGTITGVQIIFWDVTDRVRAEEELRQHREHLAERVDARTAELKAANERLEQEIVERRRVEESLRESEERFRHIFENSPLGIYRTSPDGQILMANPALWHMLGFSSFEELAQRDLEAAGFLPDSPRADFKRPIESEGRVAGFESTWARKDGTTLLVRENARVIRAQDGNPLYYEGTVEDITGRKQTEEALGRRAIQLALLNDIGGRIAAVLELGSVLDRAAELVQRSFAYHHVALFLVDHEHGDLVMKARAGAFAHRFPPDHQLKLGQGMVGWVGQRGERLLANDVAADPHYVNLYPDLVPTRAELSVPIRLGEEIVGVLDVQSPAHDAFDENDVIVMETLADQIAVAIGNARLYEALQRELTERKRAEEQLQRYAVELERANEEVKQFAYIVSHDLRAPLVNCKGFAAELRLALNAVRAAMGAALPHLDGKQRSAAILALEEDIPEALGFIESSVNRMDGFIGALLTLSRLGRRVLTLETVDVNALIQTTLQTLAYQLEERQATVAVGRLPDVVADRTSMEQILGNILTNAVGYLAPDRPGEIEITAERGSNETTFTIRDNGRGIAAEDMDKVFAPFRRAGKQD